MALAEFQPRKLATENGKPIVIDCGGRYRCDFIPGMPMSWDKQTFLDKAIFHAESVGTAVTSYESAARRLEEIRGCPLREIPKEERDKLIREVERPATPSGRFAMKMFNRVRRVKTAENKRRLVEPMFEFISV